MKEQYSEAFELIRRYAVKQGWIPIGWKDFTVGPWRIRVNGTPNVREDIPPYHALIEHQKIVAMLLINPLGGVVGGWQQTEQNFCEAMQAAISDG